MGFFTPEKCDKLNQLKHCCNDKRNIINKSNKTKISRDKEKYLLTLCVNLVYKFIIAQWCVDFPSFTLSMSHGEY